MTDSTTTGLICAFCGKVGVSMHERSQTPLCPDHAASVQRASMRYGGEVLAQWIEKQITHSQAEAEAPRDTPTPERSTKRKKASASSAPKS